MLWSDHATYEQVMGFCLFNNVTIATKCALANYKLERILIADFDVHHGNGTRIAFYGNPHVLYISTHAYPFYPGTGSIEATGSGDAEYLEVFEQIIVPAAIRSKPQFILVSAGYDNHWAGELALMQVSVTGFAQMVKIIKGLGD